MRTAAISITNQIDEIRRVAELVGEFGRAHAVPQRAIHDMDVALDEIVGNIIRYAFDDAARHEIRVSLRLEGGALTAEVEDDGRPFDPTAHAATLPRGDLAERPVGGLGLYFVRALMDGVSYARDGAVNRLRLRKLTGAAEPRAGQPPGRMRLAESRERGVTVVALSGRVDSGSARLLMDRLRAAADSGCSALLVDLAGVDYLSSGGFWSLLAALRRMEERGGRFALCGVAGEVQRLLDLAALGAVFTLYPSRERAMAAMAEPQ